MSSKRDKQKSFTNSFAALALHEEQEPKKVLQMQSSRTQKKLEHQAKKALFSPASSSTNHQQRAQQLACSTSRSPAHTTGSPSSRQHSDPCSPGFQEALTAIAIAESQETAQQAELWQQHQHEGGAFAAAAGGGGGGRSGAQRAGTQQVTAAAAAGSAASGSASPSISSQDAAWPSLWQNLPDAGSSGDPWCTGTPTAHNQQQQQRHSGEWTGLSSSPAGSFASRLRQEQQQRAAPPKQQHEEEEPEAFWPELCSGSTAAWDATTSATSAHTSSSTATQAYTWRSFAMRFAEAARAAGDEDAAAGALLFGASEPLTAAVLAAAGDATLELEEAAEQAAAAGLTVQELLQAQQEELLLQISKAKRKGPAWRQVQLDWGSAGAQGSAGGGSSSNSSSRGVSPARPQLQLPDVGDEAAFPQLDAPSPGSSGWQQVGPSPHAVSRGWKGGRLAPKGKGIKLLHTPNSSGSSSSRAPQLRPSTLDLHWDLRLEGLARLQRDNEAPEEHPIASIDPWGAVQNPAGACSGEQAAERTRQLLAEQEAALAAGCHPGAGGAGGSSGRDRFAQDFVRAMMDKAASKGSRHGMGTAAAAAANGADDAAGADEGAEEDEGVGARGSKGTFGYSWKTVFDRALSSGWEPVYKADGGGGSHFKLRRLLPISGVVQTMVLPSTPSDSQRGVRNVAAGFKKRDEEAEQLEAEALAALQAAKPQAPSKAGSSARGRRKK